MSVENVRIKKATFKMFSERFEAIACLTILFVFVRIILKANIKNEFEQNVWFLINFIIHIVDFTMSVKIKLKFKISFEK